MSLNLSSIYLSGKRRNDFDSAGDGFAITQEHVLSSPEKFKCICCVAVLASGLWRPHLVLSYQSWCYEEEGSLLLSDLEKPPTKILFWQRRAGNI